MRKTRRLMPKDSQKTGGPDTSRSLSLKGDGSEQPTGAKKPLSKE